MQSFSGIYIHIPFCKKACTYCNFHFSTSLRAKEQVLAAIKQELNNRQHYLEGTIVDTVYFGGGTPSLLTPHEIEDLLNMIYKLMPVSNQPEITLEANPDDITPAYVLDLKHSGINRLSIGIQSFHDRDLLFMGRAHTAKEALACINTSQEAGIGNLSIDLIYGTPELTNEEWITNLNYLNQLGIDHFSAYALTVEDKTKLKVLIDKEQLPPVSQEKAAEQFTWLQQFAADNSFEQYEISNLARNKNYAIHNTNYWKGLPYLGLGPAAHSFNTHSRRWNVANNSLYAQALLTENDNYFTTEELTIANRINEYIMTSLRTMWGCNVQTIANTFGTTYAEGVLREANKHFKLGNLVLKDDTLFITTSGRFFADGIAADLFV